MHRRYDAILLLGLKLNEDGSSRHELTLRIERAAQCYHQGLSPVIIPAVGKRRARRYPRPPSCAMPCWRWACGYGHPL